MFPKNVIFHHVLNFELVVHYLPDVSQNSKINSQNGRDISKCKGYTRLNTNDIIKMNYFTIRSTLYASVTSVLF